MPAVVMTAAEIAAAEAAAAQILAAQQAAAVAEAAATAQAAQVAQAAQAAQTAQAAQAATTATQASTSGIQALAQEVGTTVQPTGIETLTQAPLQATTPASELEQIRQAASGAQNMAQAPVQTQMANPSMSQAQYDFLHNSYAGPVEGGGFLPDASAVPPGATPPAPAPAPVQPPPQSAPTLYGSAQPPAPPSMGPNPLPDITAPIAEAPSLGGEGTGYRGNPIQVGTQSNATAYTPEELKIMHGQGSGIQGLLDKGIAYAEKNPLLAGMGAMTVYNMLNQPEPYRKPKYKSTFNASTYRGYEPTPPTPYTPQYAQYAKGGWAGVAPAVMKELKKTGLFKDKSSFDPSKYVASNVEPPTPYTPQYAQGGISDLGAYSDYAGGGRMLKGPGDGMSDDIPATLANKQPARLANEEFVVPADVVSHLGNGSSEAGAKALYKMMDRVRQARTGNKKQGKQINPEKYLA